MIIITIITTIITIMIMGMWLVVQMHQVNAISCPSAYHNSCPASNPFAHRLRRCVCVCVCVHRYLCLGPGIAHPIMCHCAKSMAASASAWQCKGPKQLQGRRIAHRYAVTASVILDNQTLSALGAYRGSEGSWWTPSLPTCPRLQQRTHHMRDAHASQ